MPTPCSGVLIIDKPAGISSARAVATVKKLFHAAKVGHCGTLDPFATGVLVCGLNQATRLSRFLLEADKTYEAVLHLGVETDTQDATGQATGGADPTSCRSHDVHKAFGRYIGVIEQAPPVYSALKHHGVPLYRLARRGQAVQKPPRRVRISHLEITRLHLPRIHFRVRCSAGTYIRALCADIGRDLGCGGHLAQLRRTESSGFTLDDAIDIDQLGRMRPSQRRHRLISMDVAVPRLPRYVAGASTVAKIYHGVELTDDDITGMDVRKSTMPIKIVDNAGNLLAIVEYNDRKAKIGYCCVFQEIIASAIASIPN